jgi:hypothetical protein
MSHSVEVNDIIEHTTYGEIKYAKVMIVYPGDEILQKCYRCFEWNINTQQPQTYDIWVLDSNIKRKVAQNGKPFYNTWEELLIV